MIDKLSRSHKFLALILSFFFVMLMVAVFHKDGILTVNEFKDEQKKMKESNESLSQENRKIAAEIEDLKTDPFAIEKIALLLLHKYRSEPEDLPGTDGASEEKNRTSSAHLECASRSSLASTAPCKQPFPVPGVQTVQSEKLRFYDKRILAVPGPVNLKERMELIPYLDANPADLELGSRKRPPPGCWVSFVIYELSHREARIVNQRRQLPDVDEDAA